MVTTLARCVGGQLCVTSCVSRAKQMGGCRKGPRPAWMGAAHATWDA
jgi:hypothetical protein